MTAFAGIAELDYGGDRLEPSSVSGQKEPPLNMIRGGVLF